MDEEVAELISKLIGSMYVDQAVCASNSFENDVKELLRHRKLPKEGWDEFAIERFLMQLSHMDSNNFPHQVGVGEREGRIQCPMVARRHWHLSHGIGRSGDLTAIQPKAAGSSLINQLCNALVLDAIRIAGVKSCRSCFVIPTATGMALAVCFLYLKRQNPEAKYVLWSRIDQKSCFKSILAAGLSPIIIDPVSEGDELKTDLMGFENEFEKRKNDKSILCAFTTTSCFAPRAPDKLEEIAGMCKRYNIPHLVNNAYGLQASKCCHLIEQAARIGRIDAFVQSTDKNFMVPVGGAVIAGFDKSLIEQISQNYPGRASATPSVDTLITLLWLGINGWKKLLKERKETFEYFKEILVPTLTKHGCRLLQTKSNQISLAIELKSLEETENITKVGSMLFSRSCSGARVVPVGLRKNIDGYDFIGWGSHNSCNQSSYLNVAAAIGMKKEEVDIFVSRLDKTLRQFDKKTSDKSCDTVLNGTDS